ncbi:MAG: methyltransferase domain-containing protein, partial [Planctomycetes bacterium]|nr:methyltransferase domain-containing protein [Planctomycetota bacterium]
MSKRETIEHFNEAALTWDDKPHRRIMTEKACAAVLEAGVSDKGTNVIDFGGGTGNLAIMLAPHVKSVTVVDASPGMIDVLGKKLDAAGE